MPGRGPPAAPRAQAARALPLSRGPPGRARLLLGQHHIRPPLKTKPLTLSRPGALLSTEPLVTPERGKLPNKQSPRRTADFPEVRGVQEPRDTQGDGQGHCPQGRSQDSTQHRELRVC